MDRSAEGTSSRCNVSLEHAKRPERVRHPTGCSPRVAGGRQRLGAVELDVIMLRLIIEHHRSPHGTIVVEAVEVSP